jgi:glycosyltransferase involved in cell wall biosynthesis
LGVDNDLYGSQEKTENKSKEEAFCFVGEIKPRKGLLYAIKAIEKLKDTYPDIRLYVLGKEQFGEYSNACRNYVSEKNLKDNVIFIGYIPNDKKKQYYHRCIANVLPSVNENNYFEGFGLIHLEANAAGIPSIGSKNCGNESAIRDGINGFLCAQKDVDTLYDRMRYILSIKDREEYHRFCERCKEYAQKNDWKNYIPKVLEIYQK